MMTQDQNREQIDITTMREYQELITLDGYTIVGITYDPSDPDMIFFGLTLKKGKTRKAIFIMADFEGNAPGGFEIVNL